MNRIRQIAKGDMGALESLYEAYKTPVYRLVLTMTNNQALAEDIMQDTFLRIQEKADSYHRHISEASWIFTIARNLTYDTLRKQRYEASEEIDFSVLPSSQEGNPEAGPYAFLDLIRNLSGKDVEIVSLRILADLSFKEIGQITQTSADTCSKRYNRALKKLKKELYV